MELIAARVRFWRLAAAAQQHRSEYPPFGQKFNGLLVSGRMLRTFATLRLFDRRNDPGHHNALTVRVDHEPSVRFHDRHHAALGVLLLPGAEAVIGALFTPTTRKRPNLDRLVIEKPVPSAGEVSGLSGQGGASEQVLGDSVDPLPAFNRREVQ